jgi:hypothetical protein
MSNDQAERQQRTFFSAGGNVCAGDLIINRQMGNSSHPSSLISATLVNFRDGKIMMKKYNYALLILISACLPIPAGASSLGEISAISPLGDRFRAEIPLLDPSPSITAACFRLTRDSTDAIEDIPWLTNVQIEVLSSPPRLVISTRRQVVDPVIQLAIQSSCDTSLTRHYTALLSPPADRNTALPVTDHLPGDIQPQSATARPDPGVR